MARGPNTNHQASGSAFQIATATGDLFAKGDVQLLALAVDLHDHSSTRGLPVTRVSAATVLGIRSTGAAYDTILAVTEVLTAARTITIKVNDANRTIDIAGNLTLAGALITSGANSLTLTTSGATNVTFPTTGTLATLAGTEELTAKTLTSAVGKGTWTASGTWTLPAHTLGGTVSGGGQQLNNIIIGTSTPLAGSFTTLTSTSHLVTSNDAGALGASGTAWADLFLASGGVINWNAGNYTITHSAGLLTANGALTIAGALAGVTTLATSSTINSQTISATANLTGTLTVASTYIQTAGIMYLGDNANAGMTLGLTINQGAADDEILAMKSSDVAHGVTGVTETDTYGLFRKAVGAEGGLEVLGLSETNRGVLITGVVTTVDTTKSAAALGGIGIYAQKKSGTGVVGMDANSNLLVVGDASSVRFILDADGDSHQDVGTAWTNFDAEDDLALLDASSALLGRDPGGLRRNFSDGFLVENKARLSNLRIVSFNDDTDGRPFINWSRFHMLHMGATRFIADEVRELRALVTEQAAELRALRAAS
jgi:hypothetical protein